MVLLPERPSTAQRQRPSSAGSARYKRPDSSSRPRSASVSVLGSWSRAPRFGQSSHSECCLDGSLNCGLVHNCKPEQLVGPRALRVAARRRKESQRCQWDLWSGTLPSDDMTCSVPLPLSRAMQAQWRDASKQGQRYLCIFETCQNCHEHAMTTKHDPNTYKSYKQNAMDWIRAEFPFMSFADISANVWESTRRVGAFEIYLLRPSDRSSSEHLLLHSKLLTRRWPVRENLIARVRVALPDVVPRVKALLHGTFSHEEMEASVREAEEWGLGAWDSVQALSSKIHKVNQCIKNGQQAHETGDKERLREAVRQGTDMLLPDEQMASWREDLKSKNLVLFNMKHYAQRFRRNAEYFSAVRLVQHATMTPLRLDTLERAAEKARTVEMPKEDLGPVLALLPKVYEIVNQVTESLANRNLDGLGRGLENARALSLQHPCVESGQNEIIHLASKVRMAKEVNDLVGLTEALGSWCFPSDASSGAWLSEDFAAIRVGEETRQKMQSMVDEGEKRFAAARWDALQSTVDRLGNVYVDEETWSRWTSALKRERNFSIIKAVSGAGVQLKRQLYTARLQAALRAASIPIDQLEEAVDNASMHRVEESLIQKARAEMSTVRERARAAADAASQRRVDTAEVLLWKLQSGRIRLREVEYRHDLLWEMTEALRSADATHDWQAMQKAIAGWVEDKPGSQHAAFSREESPTKAFRLAQNKIKELQLVELRRELGVCVDTLSKQSAPLDPQSLHHVARVARQLLGLGWDLTAPRRARLLALLTMLETKPTDASAHRFGATALRGITDSARIVFLLDHSKAMNSNAFNDHLKPAVAFVAHEIESHMKGVVMGAVAYGPVKVVQELTSDLSTFKEAVANHPFANGKDAPVAKSLRKALDLFRQEHDQIQESEDCGAQIVFNFISSVPQNHKDMQKACHLLEAQGVLVIGIGIGQALSEDSLQECSSPGLTFNVEEACELQRFLDVGFKSMREVLEQAEKLTPEETLNRLETYPS